MDSHSKQSIDSGHSTCLDDCDGRSRRASAQCFASADESGALTLSTGSASLPPASLNAALSSSLSRVNSGNTSRGRKSATSGHVVASRYLTSALRKPAVSNAAVAKARGQHNSSVASANHSKSFHPSVSSTPMVRHPVRAMCDPAERRASTAATGTAGIRAVAPSADDDIPANRRSAVSSSLSQSFVTSDSSTTTKLTLSNSTVSKAKVCDRLNEQQPALKVAYNQYLLWAYMCRLARINAESTHQKIQTEAAHFSELLVDVRKHVHDLKRKLQAVQLLKQLQLADSCVSTVHSRLTDQWSSMSAEVESASSSLLTHSSDLTLSLTAHHQTDATHHTDDRIGHLAELDYVVRRCHNSIDTINNVLNSTDRSSATQQQQQNSSAAADASTAVVVPYLSGLCDSIQVAVDETRADAQRCYQVLSELSSLTLEDASTTFASLQV